MNGAETVGKDPLLPSSTGSQGGADLTAAPLSLQVCVIGDGVFKFFRLQDGTFKGASGRQGVCAGCNQEHLGSCGIYVVEALASSLQRQPGAGIPNQLSKMREARALKPVCRANLAQGTNRPESGLLCYRAHHPQSFLLVSVKLACSCRLLLIELFNEGVQPELHLPHLAVTLLRAGTV